MVYNPPELAIAPVELLERLAGPALIEPAVASNVETAVLAANPVSLADTLQRAEQYVAKVPAAVQGQGGDQQTFTVACLLILDFDLTVDEALPLLLKYNARCVPPWDDKELHRNWSWRTKRTASSGVLPEEAAGQRAPTG